MKITRKQLSKLILKEVKSYRRARQTLITSDMRIPEDIPREVLKTALDAAHAVPGTWIPGHQHSRTKPGLFWWSDPEVMAEDDPNYVDLEIDIYRPITKYIMQRHYPAALKRIEGSRKDWQMGGEEQFLKAADLEKNIYNIAKWAYSLMQQKYLEYGDGKEII